MNNVSSLYGADDLMIKSLYDEGCRICQNKSQPKTADYPNDSYD